jgi:hypothetical protein
VYEEVSAGIVLVLDGGYLCSWCERALVGVLGMFGGVILLAEGDWLWKC